MNKLSELHFLKAGLQSLVQDQGRMGYQAYGVAVGGFLDEGAAKMANWLVGNELGGPVLEITLMGPAIAFGEDCQIALTGANLSPRLNGKALPMYESLHIPAGSMLDFGRPLNGCRAYLAVGGKWQLPQWLGSYSAAPQTLAWLTPESVIKKNSLLRIRTRPPIPPRCIPEKYRPQYGKWQDIRVLPGPEFGQFSRFAIGHFFSYTYPISPQSNRMGYRLQGKIADFHPKEEIISSGIVPGTIQVSNEGQPIVLLADAQTSGGYSRIANVISADMPLLAQMKPGDEVHFVPVSLPQAEKARQQMLELQARLLGH